MTNTEPEVTGLARVMLTQADRMLEQGMPHQTIIVSFVATVVALGERLDLRPFTVRVLKDAIKRLETENARRDR